MEFLSTNTTIDAHEQPRTICINYVRPNLRVLILYGCVFLVSGLRNDAADVRREGQQNLTARSPDWAGLRCGRPEQRKYLIIVIKA